MFSWSRFDAGGSGWETAHTLNPCDPTDGVPDTDHDGVPAFLEYALAMNPNVPDVQLLPRLVTRTEWEPHRKGPRTVLSSITSTKLLGTNFLKFIESIVWGPA